MNPTSSKPHSENTQHYYEANAWHYFKNTVTADMHELHDRFARYLPSKSIVLDVGSGSGRDTRAFLERGFNVEAIDPSDALARLSSDFTGIPTRVMPVEDLNEVEKYDGIWACASLLHVREHDLPDVMTRIARALKSGGVLYVSFKLGEGERISSEGRFFLDLNEPRLRRVIQDTGSLSIKEIWLSHGEDKFKGGNNWINCIAIKERD